MWTKSFTLKTLGIFSTYTEQILSRQMYAKIHSVFPNGFNLNFNDQLVYVSYHQKGKMSATGLTIDEKVFKSLQSYITIGILVRFETTQMMFYTRPNIVTVEFFERTSKDLKIKATSIEKLERINLKERLEQMSLLKKSGFSENQSLLTSLNNIHKTKEVKRSHINQLIGAGIGLTPTGDDFLQGLVLMEKLMDHLPHIEGMVQHQLKERTTTDISLSYYESLFEGYCNEPLTMLFEAIRINDTQKIGKSLSFVQEYGQTSGNDLLIGILTYLQIL